MGEQLYWWPLIKHLVEFLNHRKNKLDKLEFDGVDVYAGTKNSGKSYPCVEVTWDHEGNIDIYRSDKGNISLWIDIYLENDSEDPAAPYEILFQWQVKVLNALASWHEALKRDFRIAVKIDVPDILSDGDMQRPTCACRIITNIEWRNSI